MTSITAATGRRGGGVCCETLELATSQLAGVISPDRGWLTAQSELGIQLAVASQGSARLFSLPFTGGDSQQRALWPGVRRLTHIANRSSLFALAGEDMEGRPVLLWNINRDGQMAQMASPCAPLALTVVNTTLKTRVLCAEGVFEAEPALGTITPAVAPEAGPLRWVTRWHPPTAQADEVYLAVALGEAAQLSLWREGGEEGLTLASARGVYLPNSIGGMTPEERAEPFMPPQREGGLPSRARERRLEVWLPQLGWVAALGSRWPFSVSLSPFAPLALSVGYDEDPAKVGDSFLQRLTVYSHDLSPGGSFWGEPLKAQVAKDSLGGAQLLGFPDVGGLRPNVMILVGGGVELRGLGCGE